MKAIQNIKFKCKEKAVIVLGLFSFIVPYKRNKWVFGAWSGKLFSDNSKYLYEYIVKNHPEIDAIWITRNKDVLRQLNLLNYKCYMRFSLKGIISALRAEAAFIISNEIEISPFINRKRITTIQLWHGFGPKKESWAKEKHLIQKRQNKFRDYIWMATSEKNIEYFSEIHSTPRENFYITGYPRNDNLFWRPTNAFFENLKIKYSSCKFIIYMPTHRNFGKESIDIQSFISIDNYLKEKRIIMVYKPHFHELKNVLHLESNFSNIILANDQEIWGDPYSYIYYFDLLICDYSSIAYDFLCTGKPIVTYAYDIEHYKNQDGGLADFFFDMPLGPICMTWEETLKEVSNLLENDTWKDKREQYRKVFHAYNDGKNCERVYNAVTEVLAQDKRNNVINKD